MMRRASLVVVLVLLASVGTASAECAWVLWASGHASEKIWQSGGAMSARAAHMSLWQPYGGNKTKVECENAGRDREGLTRKMLSENNLEDDRGTRLFVRCLPDSVDPRGSALK
jgi:hypothetical protein